MQYRTLGQTDFRPSALGFGCMRFPRREDRTIDQEKVNAMLRYAVDNGVNYFDTAYVYSGSEAAVGEALAGGYREKVKLATKLPVWDMKETADADRYFAEHLERLRTDHIDFYLLHSLNAKEWAKAKELRVIDWCERKLAEDAIGYLGFSYHGGLDAFKEIVDYYPDWTFAQLQVNYIDVDHETGLAGPRYAYDKGLGLVVMEPLRGGLLATPVNEEIAAMFGAAPGGGRTDTGGGGQIGRRTPAEWALQWLWNKPEVSLVLSGMTKMEDVVENIAAAGLSGVGSMAAADEEFVARVGTAIRGKMAIPCTACGYCLPCPNGINIPEYFGYYNSACTRLPSREGMERLATAFGRWPEEGRPDQCTACGTCSERCPQGIDIPAQMDRWMRDIGVRK